MYGNPSDVCILAGSGGDHLTEEVCGLLGVPSTSCTHTKSDGGELKIAINENIRGRDAHIIQSTCHPVNDNIIELSLIVSALRRASAERVIAVVPYYGYGRQTRKLRSRPSVHHPDDPRNARGHSTGHAVHASAVQCDGNGRDVEASSHHHICMRRSLIWCARLSIAG